MVDDAQANQAITRVKSGFTSLAAPTNTLTQNMGRLNQSFTAGVSPIKAQGNALTTLNTNLKATSTTSTTLGTKIKSTAGQFAGFATGLAATSAGALQLAAGFRDYNDAQIAVERVTRKNSLAHEALTKAQDKLNALTSKGIKSGKAYEAAQLDVSQAQQMVSIQTQLLGESQERLFDSQTQFAVSVIPVTLGAIGTLGSAFKDLGGPKGMGGLVEKFKGLGSSLQTMGGNMIGAGGGIKGLIGNLGILGLAVVGAVGLFEEFNAQLKIHQDVMNKTIKPIEGVTRTLDQMSKLDFSTIESSLISLVKIIGGSGGYAELIKKIGQQDIDKLSKPVTALSTAEQKLATDEAKLISLQKERQTIGVKQEEAQLKKTIELDKAEIARLKTVKETVTATGKQSQSIGEVNDAIVKLAPNMIDVDKTTRNFNIALQGPFDTLENAKSKDLFGFLEKGGPIIQTLGDETKAADPPMKALIGTLNQGGPVMNDFLGSAKALGPPLVDAAEKATLLKKATVDVAAATTVGTDKFAAFLKTTGEAAIADKIHAAGLRSIVGAYVELDPAINLTTSDLEGMTKSIIEGKSAAIAYGDIVAKQMAPAIATFQGLLDTKNIKDFNKAFKELDLGNLDKGLGKGLKKAFEPLREISEKSGELVHLFDAMAVVGGKLSDKNIGKAIKEISDGFKDMGKTQPLIKTFGDTVLSFIKSAPNMANAWKQVNPVMQKYNELTKDGSLSLTDYNDVMAVFNETTGKAPPKLDAAQAALAKFGKESSSFVTIAAQMSASMVTSVGTAVDFVTKTLGGIASIQVPTPNESKYQKGLQLAIDNAAQTVKFIKKELDKISGIKVPAPNEKTYQKGLQLAINNAAQTVKLIGKELGKIGSIKVPAPKFNNFNSALDQAVSDAKRAVRDINNALTKVKKPSSGGGNGSGPGATTGPFNSNSSGGSKADSGGGVSGDTVINIHVMDETIMRRITARSGRGRFTMGA